MTLLKKLPWSRLIKYAITGGSAIAIDFVVYYALTRFIGVPYLLSRALSIGSALFWNFSLNRNWTFQAKAGKVHHQATRFLIVMAITSLLNLLLMRIGVSVLHLNDLLVIGLATVLTTGINFFSHQFWSYRTPSG